MTPAIVVELLTGLAFVATLPHAHGLCGLLAVPGLATLGGFAPPLVAVSHWQYVPAGVPVRFLEIGLRESVHERCWIHTSFGSLLQLVSMVFDIVYPWFLVFQWFVALLLQILGIMPLLLR